jgi:hypothetical protein
MQKPNLYRIEKSVHESERCRAAKTEVSTDDLRELVEWAAHLERVTTDWSPPLRSPESSENAMGFK